MNEFVKPLLAEEAPEPPLIEQDNLEEMHQRARQSLAGLQGATRTAEAAGLTQKPVLPVTKIAAAKTSAQVAAKQKKTAKPKVPAKAKLPPKQMAKPVRADRKSNATPQKKAKLEKPVNPADPAAADLEKQRRQEALVDAVVAMQSGPDEQAFADLFDLYTKAPDKETSAAATVLATTFLRTSAKARAPLLKVLAPAMRTWRGCKLVVLLAAKLGKVIVSKPDAAPTPPGG